MEILALLERTHLALAAGLTALGVWMAAAARPAMKRAVGVGIAHTGGIVLFAAGPRSGVDLAAAAVVVALAYTVLGAALAVRLNEVYRTQETDEIDAADDALTTGAPPK
jgi:multisubunit Na+/H+ antiporter MnhC subunit